MSDKAYIDHYRDAVVVGLRRYWPDAMVCDADVWLAMLDDPRVVEVSTIADRRKDRHRFVLAKPPEAIQ